MSTRRLLLLAAVAICTMTATAQAGSEQANDSKPHVCGATKVIPLTGSEPPAKIYVEPPLPGPLTSRGVAIIAYCAENLHIAPIFGAVP